MLNNFQVNPAILIDVAGILQIIGTVITCICYMPGAIKTLKTNDTRGISLLMFIISTFGCWFWVIISILLFTGNAASPPTQDAPDPILNAVKQNLGMTISNFCLGFFATIILYKKVVNIVKAKKAGLTEEEYVSQYIKNKGSKK